MIKQVEFLTPPQVAKRLGISKEKVLSFISSGELVAPDLSSPGSTRPRYKVSESELEAFLQRRSAANQPAETNRRRRSPSKKKRKFYV